MNRSGRIENSDFAITSIYLITQKQAPPGLLSNRSVIKFLIRSDLSFSSSGKSICDINCTLVQYEYTKETSSFE